MVVCRELSSVPPPHDAGNPPIRERRRVRSSRWDHSTGDRASSEGITDPSTWPADGDRGLEGLVGPRECHDPHEGRGRSCDPGLFGRRFGRYAPVPTDPRRRSAGCGRRSRSDVTWGHYAELVFERTRHAAGPDLSRAEPTPRARRAPRRAGCALRADRSRPPAPAYPPPP